MKRRVAILALIAAGAFAQAGAASLSFTASEVTGGTDYATASVTATLGGAPAGTKVLGLAIRGEDLGIVTQEFACADAGGNVTGSPTGFVPGGLYALAAYSRLTDSATPYVEATAGCFARMFETRDANWIAEDPDTYAGSSEGTGVWTGREAAEVSFSRINVTTDLAENPSERLVFTPTNAAVAHNLFVFTTKLSFSGDMRLCVDGTASTALSDTSALFGFAVTNTASSPLLTLADNGGWVVVSRTTFAPALDTEYTFVFKVDPAARTAASFVKDSAGVLTYLGRTSLDRSDAAVPARVRFGGSCSIAAMGCELCDKDLVRVTYAADASAGPGLNFTNRTVSGTVTLTTVHATSRTSGSYTVTLRDLLGNVAASRSFATSEPIFSFVVDSLAPGAVYATDVHVDLGDGVTADFTDDGRQARALGAWVREDVDTYAGISAGTGIWTGRDYGTVSSLGDAIVTTGEVRDEALKALTFTPVAAPAPHDGLETRLTLTFDYANDPDELPSAGRFGVTLVSGDAGPVFAIRAGGAWHKVARTLYAPATGTAYDFRFALDEAKTRVACFVAAGGCDETELGSWPVAADGALFANADAAGYGSLEAVAADVWDSRLVDVVVDLDAGGLEAGTNFTQIIARGTVIVTNLWQTDRYDGHATVRIVDAAGNVTDVLDVDFDDYRTFTGTTFSQLLEGLTAGDSYYADVTVDVGDRTDDSASRRIILANVSGDWIDEDADTYAGRETGTGCWIDEGGYASETDDGMILVDMPYWPTSEEPDLHVDYVPTNYVRATSTGYEIHFGARFLEDADGALPPDSVGNLDPASGLFGVTALSVPDVSGVLQLAILSNDVWCAVPADVFSMSFGATYDIGVAVDFHGSNLVYFATIADGSETLLGVVDLSDATRLMLEKLEFAGYGAIESMKGDLYDPRLVDVSVDFGDALIPGTNFEALASHVTVHLKELHATDRTTGRIVVKIRDANGNVVSGAGGTYGYESLTNQQISIDVGGLTAGERYTVDVSVETGDEISDATTSGESVMARALEGWIRENADTYAGRREATGVWSGRDGGSDLYGLIWVDTGAAGAPEDGLSFAPTNALPTHSGYELRLTASFPSACDVTAFDSAPGRMGVVIVEYADRNRFAVVSNGVWFVLADGYEPELDRTYEFTFAVGETDSTVGYYVTDRATGTETFLARMPVASTDVPTAVRLDGLGAVRALEGDGYDDRLFEVVIATDENGVVAGTNFSAAASRGYVRINPLWLTDRSSGTLRFVVRDKNGTAVLTNDVDFTEIGVDMPIDLYLEGLDQGGEYSIDVSTIIDGKEEKGPSTSVMMARCVGGWIAEDADTFEGLVEGTGDWSQTNGVAAVTGEGGERRIRFATASLNDRARFDPTVTSLSIESCLAKEIRYRVRYDAPGYWISEGSDRFDSAPLAAVTLAAEDDGLCSFAVRMDGGTWKVVPREIAAPVLGQEYEIGILIDYRSSNITYRVASGDVTNELATTTFVPGSKAVILEFAGCGEVASVDGDCWDANLMQVGDKEYWTFEDARAAAGEATPMIPLWLVSPFIDDIIGRFVVYDPNGLLNPRFPRWYKVWITQDGVFTIYRYNASNNWIEYAEIEGVTPTEDGWIVNTEAGLSWLAAEATNKWVRGNITLSTNLDLTAHNWTPIAQFSGTFDGAGWTIKGLNNTNIVNELGPSGIYPFGTTNDFGRVAYGLFGTASNAVFRNVRFDKIAISNYSDSASALLGIVADGDVTVSNVTVSSGWLQAFGPQAATIVGSADLWHDLTVVDNVSSADVAVVAEEFEDPRWAAGIMTVVGTNSTDNSLVVTGNVYAGLMDATVYNNANGGNVAQILAGTSWDAQFGTVNLAGNAGDGWTDGLLLVGCDCYSPGWPICNLAAAVVSTKGIDFRRYVEANDPASVPVDPMKRTARMLASCFQNGAENIAGEWMDAITAMPAGGHVTIPTSSETLEIWDTVVIDRDLTMNLGSNVVYSVEDMDTFRVEAGVTAVISNGTVWVPGDYEAFRVEPTGVLTTNDVKVVKMTEDFFERTTLIVDGYFISVTEASQYLRAGALVELFEGSDLTVDTENGAILVSGVKVASLPAWQTLKQEAGDEGTVAYMVRINEKAAPTADFTLETGGQTAKINVIGAKAGLWYAVEHKTSVVAEWTEPTESDWVYVEEDDSLIQFTVPAGDSTHFYRIRVTDYDPAYDPDTEWIGDDYDEGEEPEPEEYIDGSSSEDDPSFDWDDEDFGYAW